VFGIRFIKRTMRIEEGSQFLKISVTSFIDNCNIFFSVCVSMNVLLCKRISTSQNGCTLARLPGSSHTSHRGRRLTSRTRTWPRWLSTETSILMTPIATACTLNWTFQNPGNSPVQIAQTFSNKIDSNAMISYYYFSILLNVILDRNK